MSDSLARLLASPNATRPERDVEVCLAQGIPSQIATLTEELAELEYAAHRGGEAKADGPPRKMSQGQDPRIDELRAEIDRLNDVMREHTGRLTVAATIPQGDWRRWADANPAREEGRDEHGRPMFNAYDIQVTSGYCNATALLNRLGDFVTKWDGEPLVDGQWAALSTRAHPGDIKAAATEVVRIYEGEGARALPKSLSAWSGTEDSETS